MRFFARPRALLAPLVLLFPLLGGCVAVVAAGAVATGSSVHDRRGVGTVIDDKRIQLGAYDELNKDKQLVLQNRVMIAVYNGVMLLMGEVRTPELKQRAERIVTGFEGVHRLVNEIDVMEPEGFWSGRNDNKITARVKLALADATSVP
ncbi:MAG TPA: BON domain-containing protein, partial [Dokdonella sp.]|nr:BON domain-containing protein [Dokdonella sp.]